MAATVTVKHTWTDYAILQASAGGKEWKVQLNEAGTFRCSCPSFIFSKVSPRSCKHCRRCEAQLVTDGRIVVPSQPVVARELGEATKIFEVMLLKAGPISIAASQKRTMIEVLAARLAVFEPAPMPVASGIMTGVRRITFDD